MYLNENVPLRLTAVLASLGISAVHTILAGNQGVSDEAQLEYAARHNFILLTHQSKALQATAQGLVGKGEDAFRDYRDQTVRAGAIGGQAEVVL